MVSVNIGEVAHDDGDVSVSLSSLGDDLTTASVNLRVSAKFGNSSTINLSLDEAQEIASLLTNAVTRAAVVIAKAAEFEQEHADLTDRQQAAMTEILEQS